MVFAASMIALAIVMMTITIASSGPLLVTDIRIYEYDENDSSDYHFDNQPISPTTIKKGTEIVINGLVRNANHTAEHFDYITQIIDGNGVTVYLHVRPVAVPIGGQLGIDAERSQPLILDETGDYTIKIFTWKDTDAEPVALSAGAAKAIKIAE